MEEGEITQREFIELETERVDSVHADGKAFVIVPSSKLAEELEEVKHRPATLKKHLPNIAGVVLGLLFVPASGD